jgi:hypothetical protein
LPNRVPAQLLLVDVDHYLVAVVRPADDHPAKRRFVLALLQLLQLKEFCSYGATGADVFKLLTPLRACKTPQERRGIVQIVQLMELVQLVGVVQ